MYWIFPYLCIRNELFDSIAPQNAENRTVANSLLLFLKCSIKCLFLKWLCQTVENLKYIQSKFLRFLVSIKKNTQHSFAQVYQLVPLQDFTPASDIDWSRSIHDIDLQLYRKYGLDEKEIEFIESHVKEMA